MEPTEEPLRFYGAVQAVEALPWRWVEEQLEASGLYWVVPRSEGHPHPRPVWGVWADGRLHVSLGSPPIRRQLELDPAVTVHLDSGIDVVIVEGRTVGSTAERALIDRYDEKYDYTYDADQYGPFLTIEPEVVLAWRSAGPAGRDGFVAAGRYRFLRTR